MEKQRLLEILKTEPKDIEAIGMILSNYADYGHSEMGGMVSVKQFDKVAECLLEWWNGKKPDASENILPINSVSNNEVAVCDTCGCHPTVLYVTEFGRHCVGCKPQTDC